MAAAKELRDDFDWLWLQRGDVRGKVHDVLIRQPHHDRLHRSSVLPVARAALEIVELACRCRGRVAGDAREHVSHALQAFAVARSTRNGLAITTGLRKGLALLDAAIGHV